MSSAIVRNSPARGVREQPASQSQREAAFYQALVAMGLERYAPRADLLLIDGKQYAAMEWLGKDYAPLEDEVREHGGRLRARMLPLLASGTLHRLALADWILGNPDRNGGNAMTAHDDALRLIDHGSALAGASFDPANDPMSYAPFYLRLWASPTWAQLPAEERLAALPRLSSFARDQLRAWTEGLDEAALRTALEPLGADPAPILARLGRAKAALAAESPDVAVNRLWAVG